MATQNIFPADLPFSKQTLLHLPGVGLVALIAGAAIWLKSQLNVPLLGPMVIAMLLGVGLRNTLGPMGWAAQGIYLAQRPLMRFGIVLLGLKLSLGQIWDAGAVLFLGIAALLAFSYYSTQVLGRMLGVGADLSRLIGAGTAVCGASAVMAVQGARPGSQNDLAYAIACVTLFGTLSMLGLPLMADLMGLTATEYGLWAGASIHEVAQVVGATDSHSAEAAEWGMMAKLSRVLLLAPLILVLTSFGSGARDNDGDNDCAPSPLPWFVVGFAALMVLNSAVALPSAVLSTGSLVSGFLLTMALAAMGLSTDLAALKRKGLRPLALGAVATLIVTLGALLVVMVA